MMAVKMLATIFFIRCIPPITLDILFFAISPLRIIQGFMIPRHYKAFVLNMQHQLPHLQLALLAIHRSLNVKPVGKTLTQLVQIPLKNSLQRNI